MNTPSGQSITDHKCKIGLKIMPFDASNGATPPTASYPESMWEYLGLGEYYSVKVNGETKKTSGAAHFYRRRLPTEIIFNLCVLLSDGNYPNFSVYNTVKNEEEITYRCDAGDKGSFEITKTLMKEVDGKWIDCIEYKYISLNEIFEGYIYLPITEATKILS